MDKKFGFFEKIAGRNNEETVINNDITVSEIETVKNIDVEGITFSNSTDEEKIKMFEEMKKLNLIHTTWRDYALMLVNSTPDPLRSIWREKIITSITHWEFDKGSISEGNLAGCEVLSELPSEFTEMVVDDHFVKDVWEKLGRLNGSKRMNVHLGHYPQESISNEANLCLKYIVNNWDKYIHLIWESELLTRMWDLAQKSAGECIRPDEVCTYILEKPVNDSNYGVWIDVAEDVFSNGIPSETYREYWKSDKIEGYPLSVKDETGIYVWTHGAVQAGYAKHAGMEVDLEEQKKNFLKLVDVILREDVSWSPCYKKICICVLKNDVSFKYAGFGATLRERKAREEAISAFSTKQEEKEKAKANAEQLAKKIEKERLENEKLNK